MNRHLPSLLAMLVVLPVIALCGPLDPPAAPAPTYKTLDEVEARTPIRQADIPLTISQDGSYYLVEDIVVTTVELAAITISSSALRVTIDLNGFTVADAIGATTAGITVFTPSSHPDLTALRIHNGRIHGFPGDGILSTRRNTHVHDVFISSCGNGIVIGDHPGAVIRNCTILDIGGPEALVDTHAQGFTVGVRAGPDSLVEDTIVRNGRLRDSATQGIHGIWITQRGVIRNCKVSNMETTHETSNNIIGIRASIGSIVEGCSVTEIGSDTNSAGIVRGIWANQSTVRNNLVRGIRNYDQLARGIETLDGSRVARNHIMDIMGFSAIGILATRESLGFATIENNMVQRLRQNPFVGFESPIGILNNTHGGLTQANSLEIDEPPDTGIQVSGPAHRIIANTIAFPTGVPGFLAIAIRVPDDAPAAYVAANVGIRCTIEDFSTDTILGSTPAPNQFEP